MSDHVLPTKATRSGERAKFVGLFQGCCCCSHIQRIGCQPEKHYFTRWPIPLVVRRSALRRWSRSVSRPYKDTYDSSARPMGVASQNSTLPCAIPTFPVSLPLSSPGDVQGSGRLDAGSRADFTSSRPPPPWTLVLQFSYFCTMCGLEKLGLVDQNWLERNFPVFLLRTLVVDRRQYSESIEVALDME